jgi:pimeloyl-[acyl-carrier protein] methyl ester esterase
MSINPKWLWIPGWGSRSDVWGTLWEALPEMEHYTVGFHDCEKPEDFVGKVRQSLRNHPDTTEWCLVGWSMGSLLALQTAKELGERVKGLVLIGGTANFCHPNPAWGWSPRIVERMRRKLSTDPEQVYKEFMRSQFTAEEQSLPTVQAWMDHSVHHLEWTTGGLEAGLNYLMETDLSPELHQFASPALILHGEMDTVCPWLQAKEMSLRLKDARVYSWPNCGHVPFVTETHRLAKELRAFHHETIGKEKYHS